MNISDDIKNLENDIKTLMQGFYQKHSGVRLSVDYTNYIVQSKTPGKLEVDGVKVEIKVSAL